METNSTAVSGRPCGVSLCTRSNEVGRSEADRSARSPQLPWHSLPIQSKHHVSTTATRDAQSVPSSEAKINSSANGAGGRRQGEGVSRCLSKGLLGQREKVQSESLCLGLQCQSLANEMGYQEQGWVWPDSCRRGCEQLPM
ncbi:hypothetical protein JZ751_017913, partial [Albula glossodonta]